MKKIFTMIALALILVSCQGPMGPQGPQGPPGQPGEGVNWKVYDFTIPSDRWELVNGENQLNSYFMYVFDGNEAPKELQYVTQYDGDVSGYFIGRLDNGEELYSPLPYEVYAGQVVGEHVHEKDLVINVTKSKKLTNMRASGSDDKARIIPPVVFSLEEALEYIKADEYVEVTPKSMRMRKVILDELERKRANKE